MPKKCKDCDWFGYTDDVLECRHHPFKFKLSTSAICDDFKERGVPLEYKSKDLELENIGIFAEDKQNLGWDNYVKYLWSNSKDPKIAEIKELVQRLIDEAAALKKYAACDKGSEDPNYLLAHHKSDAIQYCVLQLCKILLKD